MGLFLNLYRAHRGQFNLGIICKCAWTTLDSSYPMNVPAIQGMLGITSLTVHTIFLSLLTCGDIESNPGPVDHMSDSDKYISFCHANMRSIKNCLDKLDHIKADFCGKYDIITLSETWLNPTDRYDATGKPIYELEGYQEPFRRDRVDHRGGGVLAWVSNGIVCKRRSELEDDSIELMWLELRSKNNKFLLGIVYRTDEQIHFWDVLQRSFNKALDTNISYILITGDINADPATVNGRTLHNFVEVNGLTKHINEPTRITPTSRSELDQILSNCSHIVTKTEVLSPVSYNDHHTVVAKLSFKIKKSKSYQRLLWDFSHADFTEYRDRLSNINWNASLEVEDIDLATQMWTEYMTNAARETLPNKMVTIRPWDKPFFNGYLRRLKRSKDRCHRLAKYDNTPESWENFRQVRTFYFNEIKRIKSESEQKLLSQLAESAPNSPKRWWRLSGKLLKNQQQGLPAIIDNDSIMTDDSEKAQSFNKFFLAASRLDNNDAALPDNYPYLTTERLSDLEILEDDLLKLLQNLDVMKAFGPDDIHPRFLKEGANILHLCANFSTNL